FPKSGVAGAGARRGKPGRTRVPADRRPRHRFRLAQKAASAVTSATLPRVAAVRAPPDPAPVCSTNRDEESTFRLRLSPLCRLSLLYASCPARLYTHARRPSTHPGSSTLWPLGRKRTWSRYSPRSQQRRLQRQRDRERHRKVVRHPLGEEPEQQLRPVAPRQPRRQPRDLCPLPVERSNGPAAMLVKASIPSVAIVLVSHPR